MRKRVMELYERKLLWENCQTSVPAISHCLTKGSLMLHESENILKGGVVCIENECLVTYDMYWKLDTSSNPRDLKSAV